MSGIVVGVDGSAESRAALSWAVREGSSRGLPVTALAAWSVPVLPGTVESVLVLGSPRSYEQAARDALQEAVDDVRQDASENAGPVDVVTTEGHPGRSLVERARGAELLVVGDRGAGQVSRILLGSTTNYVLHHAPCPVVVVPAGAPVGAPRRVVVGVDGSSSSRQALEWAADEAERLGAPLVGVFAWLVTTLAEPARTDRTMPAWSEWQAAAAEQLQVWVSEVLRDRAQIAATSDARHGPPATVLLELVRPDDLLVLGSRGRGGFSDLLLGSTSLQCAEHGPCPVVVVRQPDATR